MDNMKITHDKTIGNSLSVRRVKTSNPYVKISQLEATIEELKEEIAWMEDRFAWVSAKNKLPEPFEDAIWNINDRYVVGWLDGSGSLCTYTLIGTKMNLHRNMVEISDMVIDDNCQWMYLPKEG